MLGLASLDLLGIQGAVIQMVSHGLTAAGLFLIVGMIYERCHTRELERLRRHRPAAARVLVLLHDPDARLGRPADDERVHRRIPRAAGRVHRVVAAVPAGPRAAAGVERASRCAASFSARSTCCGSRSSSCSASSRRRTRRWPTSTCARSSSSATHRRRRVRARALPRRADAQDRARGEAVPAAGRAPRTPGRRHERTRPRQRTAMSWQSSDRDAAGAPAARRHRAAARAGDRLGAAARRARAVAVVVAARPPPPRPGCIHRLHRGRRSRASSRSTPAELAREGASCWRSRCRCCCSRATIRRGPFYPLLLSSLYGFCLLLSSDSFLTLFLGLEIMSLPVYVLVLLAFGRPESPEAALKYLVLGGAATAMFLMGVSLLYGGSGSLALSTFAGARRRTTPWRSRAVVLVVVSFFLKAAIVPFHAWAPDAYEGASVPVTAYMATIIKAGVLLAALRLFGNGAGDGADGRPARAPAAGVDRLGQPGRDAAAELPPDDRVLVDRPRGLPVLRVPRRRRPAASRRSSSTCSPTG